MIIIKSQDGAIAEYKRVLQSVGDSDKPIIIALNVGSVHSVIGEYESEEKA